MDDRLQRLYGLFDPSLPLTADQSDLYVDLDPGRGGTQVVAKLEERIRRTQTGISCQLLAGHMGCGKSTELQRLRERLRTGTPRFFTAFVKALEATDVYDLDFPELLIAVVRVIAQEMQSVVGVSLKPGRFTELLRGLGEWVTNVKVEQVELSGLLGSVSLAAKGSKHARREIRKALDPDTSNLLAAANDVIGQALTSIRGRQYAGLVVIVDGLDRVPTSLPPDEKLSRAENLFVQRYAQMTGFSCHVVYTLPLPLAYSTTEAQISTRYGGRPPVLPMVKLTTRPPKRAPDEHGPRLMAELIERRLKKADVAPSAVFDPPELIGEVVRLCGGQPRELMMLMREAMIGVDRLPITKAAVDRAAREGTIAYARQLREEHWPILLQVARTGELKRSMQTDGLIRELLETRAVLQYRNEDEWYDVNPLIELPESAGRRKPPATRKPAPRRPTARKPAKRPLRKK